MVRSSENPHEILVFIGATNARSRESISNSSAEEPTSRYFMVVIAVALVTLVAVVTIFGLTGKFVQGGISVLCIPPSPTISHHKLSLILSPTPVPTFKITLRPKLRLTLRTKLKLKIHLTMRPTLRPTLRPYLSATYFFT